MLYIRHVFLVWLGREDDWRTPSSVSQSFTQPMSSNFVMCDIIILLSLTPYDGFLQQYGVWLPVSKQNSKPTIGCLSPSWEKTSQKLRNSVLITPFTEGLTLSSILTPSKITSSVCGEKLIFALRLPGSQDANFNTVLPKSGQIK